MSKFPQLLRTIQIILLLSIVIPLGSAFPGDRKERRSIRKIKADLRKISRDVKKNESQIARISSGDSEVWKTTIPTMNSPSTITIGEGETVDIRFLDEGWRSVLIEGSDQVEYSTRFNNRMILAGPFKITFPTDGRSKAISYLIQKNAGWITKLVQATTSESFEVPPGESVKCIFSSEYGGLKLRTKSAEAGTVASLSGGKVFTFGDPVTTIIGEGASGANTDLGVPACFVISCKFE